MATTLKPYIFFYGRCREALDFYKGVFGGDAEVMLVKDSPMADQWPPEGQNTVMHASFTSDAIAFFASDGPADKTIDPDAGNISLTLSFDDDSSAEGVFSALAQGGKIIMPLEPAFWGGRFGTLVDKFGNEWMATTP